MLFLAGGGFSWSACRVRPYQPGDDQMIRPSRSEADYNEALQLVEHFFQHEPTPGTLEADTSALPALVLADYQSGTGPSTRRTRSKQSDAEWKRQGTRGRTWAVCSARVNAPRTF